MIPTAAKPDEDYLTTEEVAKYLRCSVRAVRRWHQQGNGPESVLIAGRRLYHFEDVEAWVDAEREREAIRRLHAV